MPSDRSLILIVAVVSLLILFAAAASLSDPAVTGDGFGSPGDWFDDSGELDGGEQDGGEVDPDDGGVLSTEVLCFPILLETEVQLLLIALAGLLGLSVGWVANRWIAVAVLTMTVPMGFVVYLALLGACQIDTSQGPDEMGLGGVVSEQMNETAGQAVDTATDPLLVLLLLAAIGLLAIGIVVLRDDVSPTEDAEFVDPGQADDSDLDAIAIAAGDAADRLEDGSLAGADLDNEIYRAWAEMTTYLEVDDPETSTPGEFADAAIEAGMVPDDVHSLTELFESVRYGGEPPTSEREAAAIEVLRRIEADYGDTE